MLFFFFLKDFIRLTLYDIIGGVFINYIDHKHKGIFPQILVNKINKSIIRKEIKNTYDLLSNVNGYSLDFDQRVAIVTDECSNLVIAGAGSGKSLTIIGKIRYLVQIKKINPKDILCITFTHEAAKNLEGKININYNYNINVYTFHKLALTILSNENYKISSDDTLDYIVNEYFYMLEFDDRMKRKVKKILLMNNASYKSVLKSKKLINLKKVIISFINLFKTNNYKTNDFLKFKGDKDLLRIIIDIYFLYEDELKSQKGIDFNDMIIKATNYLDNNEINNYKYIIIDEYQDTSYIRYLLVKKIIDKTGAKIMCVGDDYQSIYRFTGCNLDMFLNFKKYFGYTKILKIKNTYRNSQELINVAGNFIMKSPQQLYKKLYSDKSIEKPIKIMFGDDLNKLLDYVLDKHRNILILGRNNFDIDKYFKLKDDYIVYKNKKIKYLTVHKSKGLEEESVILINLIDDILGFPNKKEEESILKNFFNRRLFPYDEERRLFYVALTRTKSDIYLLVPSKKRSIFINEIIKSYSRYIEFI